MPTVDDELQQELLKRAMSAQDLPTIPSTEFGSRVPDNYGVRRAIDMLHKKGLSAGMPLIGIDDKMKALRRPGGIERVGYTSVGAVNPRIYLTKWSDVYRKATLGNKDAIRELASALAHERHHVEHGKDELPAYDKQIEVLKLLGGNTTDLERARASIERSGKR